MLSLSDNNQIDVSKAFNSNSRYLEDLSYVEPLSLLYLLVIS